MTYLSRLVFPGALGRLVRAGTLGRFVCWGLNRRLVCWGLSRRLIICWRTRGRLAICRGARGRIFSCGRIRNRSRHTQLTWGVGTEVTYICLDPIISVGHSGIDPRILVRRATYPPRDNTNE
jgi:hypothetical protein